MSEANKNKKAQRDFYAGQVDQILSNMLLLHTQQEIRTWFEDRLNKAWDSYMDWLSTQ